MCEAMLMDGEYEGPDVTNNLDACLRIGAQYLDEARNGDAPEKHIDLIYRFLDDVAAIQESLKAPAAPASAAAPGAPGTQPAGGATPPPTGAAPPAEAAPPPAGAAPGAPMMLPGPPAPGPAPAPPPA